MHLARVIFFLGGRRDEGSRPGSPAANIPECFRLGAAGSLQIVPTPTGLVEHREPERPSSPTVWLRLPTVKSLGLRKADGLRGEDLRRGTPS
jgi:hypothetical protein